MTTTYAGSKPTATCVLSVPDPRYVPTTICEGSASNAAQWYSVLPEFTAASDPTVNPSASNDVMKPALSGNVTPTRLVRSPAIVEVRIALSLLSSPFTMTTSGWNPAALIGCDAAPSPT